MDGCVEMQSDSLDSLDALRPLFVAWFDQNIQIDAEWLARLGPAPRWCAGLNALHRHCSAWLIEKERAAPPALTDFATLLLELGCAIHTAGGERLILGVCLREDVEAQRDFPAIEHEPPKLSNHHPRGGRSVSARPSKAGTANEADFDIRHQFGTCDIEPNVPHKTLAN
jgi:hypothetical protein